MKFVLTLALLSTSVVSVAIAGESGEISRSTLSALGLGDMMTLSDAQGMQVRGMHANAATRGSSIAFGLVVDPVTSSFLSGTDTDLAASTTDGSGSISAAQGHAVGINLVLDVGTGTSAFMGTLVSGSGGISRAHN